MKNKTLTFTLAVLAIVIFCGYTIFKLHWLNEQARANLPYLDIGEHIGYFDLIAEDSSRVNTSIVNSGRPAMIFIASRPCTPCQKNVHYWRKFKKILGDCIDYYGIIPTDATTAFNFSERAKLNFKIYVPADLKLFIQGMRLKTNNAQTIVYDQNEVKYIKLGNLERNDALHIINLAKELGKTSENINK
jgi:hypothetical protein